ncbi:ABC transporter substrate-binding protein [Rhizobium leguminosarum]|uniref:ABC transporter substrate-binding protein n=1 Tax=Rhizobium leguminosarum TaxID=384 RepID=UPI0004B15799|nr:ABC transporter substrate-binding protein [Rhizobium leguminosarum]WFT91134.1 ABC transporter substrate-binding protein [Rhizobium leguminosarum]
MTDFGQKLTQAEMMAKKGALSRRDFMQLAAAVGIAVPMASTIFSKAQAQEPKKGGNLKLGMEGGSASDSWDPRTYSDSIMMMASLTIMNGLIEFDSDGKATGELLESWDVQPGAQKWVFNVRKDVTFSNGKKLDADDIIYSIQIHRGETKSPARGLLQQIEEIKVLSPHQIGITLSSGNIDFPAILGDNHIVVIPKDHTDWQNPIGTGAYALESFEPGVRIAVKNRGDYWKPNRGNFDTVEILYIQDAAARTAALQSGEVHGVNRLDPRTVELLMKEPSVSVVRTKGTGNRFCFVSRVTDDPFTNKDLRTALKWGIDRDKIIKQVLNGYAILGNDHILDPHDPFYNSDLPQRSYDPDKASFYFKKAGVSSNAVLQTSEGAWGSAVDCAEIYQQSLKAAGIDLGLSKVSADGYWSNVWLKAPFCASYWGRRPTADQTLSLVYSSSSDWNETNWKVPEFDKLLAEARVEFDDAKRKEMYGKCQEMIYEDGGTICFAIADYLDGYSTSIQGVKPHARYDMDDNRVAEKAWFA